MLRSRIEKGQATGVLCPAEEVPAWIERLEEVPLLREVGGDSVRFFTGAVVVFRTTAEEAQSWERGNRSRPVVWIDDGNLLEAPLPAPKPKD
jgi:hypothetical protein